MKRGLIILGIILLILIILVGVWGVIGGNISQKRGVFCNFGIKDKFCLIWEDSSIDTIPRSEGVFGG